jgi:hypothetical protein
MIMIVVAVKIFLCFKFCLSRLETVGLQVPARMPFKQICPRCVSGTNVVHRYVDVCGTKTLSPDHIL